MERNSFAFLALFWFAVGFGTHKSILSIVGFISFCENFPIIIFSRSISWISCSEFVFTMAFCTLNNIHHLSYCFILQFIEFLIPYQLPYLIFVYAFFAIFRQAVEVTPAVDKFIINVFFYASKAEQMPALLDIKKGVSIKWGIEFFHTFFASNDILWVSADIYGWGFLFNFSFFLRGYWRSYGFAVHQLLFD